MVLSLSQQLISQKKPPRMSRTRIWRRGNNKKKIREQKAMAKEDARSAMAAAARREVIEVMAPLTGKILLRYEWLPSNHLKWYQYRDSWYSYYEGRPRV